MSEIESLITEFEALYYGIGARRVDKEAARQLMEHIRAKCRYAEAWCLKKGWGVAKDCVASSDLFRELSGAGYERAHVMYGECLFDGIGVRVNAAEAVEHFEKVTESPIAQEWLGFCYFYGRGVPCDRSMGVQWWSKAAEQGHVDAQAHLADCYRFGMGTDQDFTQALKWVRQAAYGDPSNYSKDFITLLRDYIDLFADEKTDLLWEALRLRSSETDLETRADISVACIFWTSTLPPLRILAAKAVVEAGESADEFHEGISMEVELVRKSLRAAGLYH